jgi:nucleotide-binding universal stress UspA family protein
MRDVNISSKNAEIKILHLTDFSDDSWRALQYAINLFEDRSCDFYLLNTYKDVAEGFHSPVIPDAAIISEPAHKSREGLGQLLVRLSQMDISIRHRFHVISRKGNIIEEVCDVAEALAVNMVVIGVKNYANKWRGKYSRNTLALVENVGKIPVLIVPANASVQRPEEIVLATNFDTDLHISEIEYLADLAHFTKASVKVFSLNKHHPLSPGQKEKKMLVSKGLKNVKHSFSEAPDKTMTTSFESLNELQAPGIITYIEGKPSFWSRLGFGRKALGKIGNIKNTPVLVLQS